MRVRSASLELSDPPNSQQSACQTLSRTAGSEAHGKLSEGSGFAAKRGIPPCEQRHHVIPALWLLGMTRPRRFGRRLQTRRAGPGKAKTSRRARTRDRGEEHPGPAASTNLDQGLPSWVFAKVPG